MRPGSRQVMDEVENRITDEPCGKKCGRCSLCARAIAAHRNKARFGQPDYPGQRIVLARNLPDIP